MLKEKNPDAVCVYEKHRKYGGHERCCTLSRLKMKASPSRITLASAASWVVVSFSRADYEFLRFENAMICIDARRHATLGNSPRKLSMKALYGTSLWTLISSNE